MAHILLIEPDLILSDTLRKAFEQSGHSVHVQSSGQSALDSLDDQVPDVIVLELQLGLHNGIEYLYELRSYEDWAKIPVVIHSGNRNALSSKYAVQWRLLGVSKLFYKPTTTVPQIVSELAGITSRS
jgi:DNA-binding response OmpR family regulator